VEQIFTEEKQILNGEEQVFTKMEQYELEKEIIR
jgi:hypothetical protein